MASESAFALRMQGKKKKKSLPDLPPPPPPPPRALSATAAGRGRKSQQQQQQQKNKKNKNLQQQQQQRKRSDKKPTAAEDDDDDEEDAEDVNNSDEDSGSSSSSDSDGEEAAAATGSKRKGKSKDDDGVGASKAPSAPKAAAKTDDDKPFEAVKSDAVVSLQRGTRSLVMLEQGEEFVFAGEAFVEVVYGALSLFGSVLRVGDGPLYVCSPLTTSLATLRAVAVSTAVDNASGADSVSSTTSTSSTSTTSSSTTTTTTTHPAAVGPVPDRIAMTPALMQQLTRFASKRGTASLSAVSAFVLHNAHSLYRDCTATLFPEMFGLSGTGTGASSSASSSSASSAADGGGGAAAAAAAGEEGEDDMRSLLRAARDDLPASVRLPLSRSMATTEPAEWADAVRAFVEGAVAEKKGEEVRVEMEVVKQGDGKGKSKGRKQSVEKRKRRSDTVGNDDDDNDTIRDNNDDDDDDTVQNSSSSGSNNAKATYPTLLVCGVKDGGKSTFARYAVNKLLTTNTIRKNAFHNNTDNYNNNKGVAYIDCDLGQSEFTPPGSVSFNIVHQPLLGPAFSHMAEQHQHQQYHQHQHQQHDDPHRQNNNSPLQTRLQYFLGTLSPKDIPKLYLSAVFKLIDAYRWV